MASKTTEDGPKMENLSQLLKRAIREGAPLFNSNKRKECYEIYLEAAELGVAQEMIARHNVGQCLAQSIEEAKDAAESRGEWGEAAWVLRRCFDDILDENQDGGRGNSLMKRASRLVIESTESLGSGEDDALSSGGDTSSSFWQDELVENATDVERGQSIADIAFIIRASIKPGTHVRYLKLYEDCFEGCAVVELLTSLGLGARRKFAEQRATKLLKGGLILPVSHPDETFKDGTHLYRFPSQEEILATRDKLIASGDKKEGSDDAIMLVALSATLELPSEAKMQQDGENSLQPRRRTSILSSDSQEHSKGRKLAELTSKVEKIVDIRDRKFRLKTYKKCFVGEDAITDLVTKGVFRDRKEALEQLNDMLCVGLIRHVTRGHEFEDKKLFYEFAPVGDVKKGVDAFASLPNEPHGTDLVRYAALVHRYKQFAGLNVTEILNLFYGCDDESGWDTVDLQNWRNNMKRWGFGRREDQDDDMVEKLAPLALNVDPDTWNVSGDEEWESPFGILAQIAIFDQVPRSAFRGTPKAFKWDQLAIRASKVAIEKGYFETAYKSTLNQFVVLLPLEHSESWEEQKLGVTLLLELLSKVAIQDEGLSDYEIVKRLEFSKRLTTAFLEHAQVVAKFKRFPHRNRAQGRTTSLEERIWLASDLVPRWAKSQNPEDAKNVVQLPVIPLKRLTRGK